MKGGMKTDINIGLSGSKLKILEGGVIRKYSPGEHFEDRFKLQIEKQLLFVDNKTSNIVTPAIYTHTREYFDMQYIPGESYNEFFSKSSKQDLDNISSTCIEYFNNQLRNSENFKNNEVLELIKSKLNKVKLESTHKDYIDYIIDKVNSTNFNNVPKSDCHGDFSVSNMIFFKGKLCCIDFLDSYIDTVIVDMVKLKQDLYYKWILDINKSNLRIRQSFNYLWSKIYSEFKQYYNLEFTEFITILNWLRIEPYLKTEVQKKVLNNKIISSKYYEEFISSSSR
jgi:hypothetical protein